MTTDRSHAYVSPSATQLADAQAFVDRFAAIWARPDAGRLHELMHEDTRNLIPPMAEPAGRDGVVEHFRQVIARLPDLALQVERWMLHGDWIVIDWRATASVAGQPYSWTGLDKIRLRGDRTAEAVVTWDTRRVAEDMARLAAAAAAR